MQLYRYIAVILIFLSLTIAITVGCNRKKPKEAQQIAKVDSLLNIAKISKAPPSWENRYLFPAYVAVLSIDNDSIKMAYLNKIAFESAASKDSTLFMKSVGKQMHLAENRSDTLAMAYAHWNYGIYHLQRNVYDSSYYHYENAFKMFKGKNNFYGGKMLYNMAYISSKIKDYTGSEILLFKAIAIFEKLNKDKQLYSCYNLLGAVYDNLKEYDNALGFYNTALEYLDKVENKYPYLVDTQNNIGLVYQKTGRLREATAIFEEALQMKNLKKLDPALYARITDNKAFTLFRMGRKEKTEFELLQALHLRDSINNDAGSLISHLHLGEYYLKTQDTIAALGHATLAYQIGKEMKLHRDALSALLLLAEITPLKKEEYLKEHIQLNEVLMEDERKVRNKFTRIQYETDSYIKKNQQLVRDKIWIVSAGAALTIILILLIITFKQRAKNNALEFEAKQQQANEKIYLLTLKQQANLNKGRLQERRRISEELHDDILARLFGIRLNWEFLKVSGENEVLEKHKQFLASLQHVEKDIRNISHDLKNDLFLNDTLFIRNVEKMLYEWSHQAKFSITIESDPQIQWEGVNNYLKANVYKILEEAMHNIAKHSDANAVTVELKRVGKYVNIHVEDNGKGFAKRFSKEGMGIKNMKSRTVKLKGTFYIHSVPGAGTKIHISVPIKM